MSKIHTLVTFTVSSQEHSRAKLMLNLGNMGARLQSQSLEQMVLKRGSQMKTRLLGGFFVKDTDLPIIATITFDPTNPEQVHVLVSEHLVIGTNLGMRDKQQRACTDFAQALAQALR